jgi:hypothetical protein
MAKSAKGWLCHRVNGDQTGDARALVRSAGDLDPPAMQFDKTFDQA